MATYWTIAVGATEKRLDAWGVADDFSRWVMNKGKATVTLRTTERFDPGASQWAFKAHAIVWRDRASADGSDNSFSGGTIYFQGYFDDPERVVADGLENIRYKLHSVWWLFERNQFKQYRNQFTSWDHTHQRVQSAGVFAAGAGYKVGDVLTVAGGAGTAAQVTVATITGGGATGPLGLVFVSNSGGSYTSLPASPNTPSGGTGTGAQLTLSFSQVPNLMKVVMSEVYLGEKFDAANTIVVPQNNGDQVGEVIDWVNETYNPTRQGAVSGQDATQDVVVKGTIDPHCFMPISRVNTLSCSDAIKNCLQLTPDTAVVEDLGAGNLPRLNFRTLGKWNYGTVPPTFIDYTNLTELTINITSDQEKEIVAQSQLGKILPGVIIYYKSVNVLDGALAPQVVVDKFPGGITDFTPEVQSHTIELAGEKLSHVTAGVQTTAIAPLLSGVDATVVAWWKAHDKSLGDINIKPDTIHAIGTPTITDDNNVAINTATYPNELLSALPGWVGASWVWATVKQVLKFERYATQDYKVPDVTQGGDAAGGRLHSKRIVLTNAVTSTYSAVSDFQSAELVPVGVAEAAYRSAAATQTAGKIAFTKSQLRSDITMGLRLKLVGPNTTFTNLLVQAIEEQPLYGRTMVTFGPCPPIDVDIWVEMSRASRTRTTYAMPSGRADGGVSNPSGAVDTGSNSPADSTAHGVGGFSRHGASFIQS